MDVLHFFDALIPVAEQVIDVPKIIIERIPVANLGSRASAGGTAGGSTDDHILVFLFAADYGAERRHSSSWWWRRLAGLQGSLPGQSSTAPTVEQIIDIPGGRLQGFALVRLRLLFILQLDLMMTRMSLVKGVFALFPG